MQLGLLVTLLALTLLGSCAAPGGAPGGAPARATDDAVRLEVEQLHAFFEGWFTGRLEPTDEAFARFESVLADGFEIVSPRGTRTERAALLAGLRSAHRMHPDGFRIWIEDVRARALEGGLTLATYEEWQEQPGGPPRGRLSSAVLRARADTPNGLEWVHVHETWLDEAP